MAERYAVIEAPSVLGLFPGGVERLPEVLLDLGLADRLGARRHGAVLPPPYDPQLDPTTGVLNAAAIAAYAVDLADAVGSVLDGGEVPVVLGGDCSILLGTQLALRRRGRFGLLFLDGHADFYQPAAEPEGQAASMDLALATGHGPELLTGIEGRAPLVREADVAHLGRRDGEEADEAGSRRIEESAITMVDLDAVRADGIAAALARALTPVTSDALAGFWLHLDCDVLDDELVPAVDYRLPGGLRWDELEAVLRAAVGSGRLVGVEVTILNPSLDPGDAIAQRLVDALVAGLAPG